MFIFITNINSLILPKQNDINKTQTLLFGNIFGGFNNSLILDFIPW